MSTTCAWCNNEMDYERGALQEGGTIIRSICTTCLESFAFQMGVPLQNFLDRLPVPIFVVNDDVVVQAANKQGYALLSEDAQSVLKKLGGIVFDCAYAQLPEGCGRTVHCSGCAIRRSVYHTYTTGQSLVDVWNQTGQYGQAVPPGTYFFDVTIGEVGGSKLTFCPSVTIDSCPTPPVVYGVGSAKATGQQTYGARRSSGRGQ